MCQLGVFMDVGRPTKPQIQTEPTHCLSKPVEIQVKTDPTHIVSMKYNLRGGGWNRLIGIIDFFFVYDC